MKTLNNVFRLLLLLTAISTPLTSNADVTSDVAALVAANANDPVAAATAIADYVTKAVAKDPASAAAITTAAVTAAPTSAGAITAAAVTAAPTYAAAITTAAVTAAPTSAAAITTAAVTAAPTSAAGSIATAASTAAPNAAGAIIAAASAVVPTLTTTIANDVLTNQAAATQAAATTPPTTAPSSENTVAAVAQTAAIVDVISKTAAVKFATETATNACATSSDPGCFTKQYSKDLAAETKAVETALISKTSDSATTTTAVDNVHAAVSPN